MESFNRIKLSLLGCGVIVLGIEERGLRPVECITLTKEGEAVASKSCLSLRNLSFSRPNTSKENGVPILVFVSEDPESKPSKFLETESKREKFEISQTYQSFVYKMQVVPRWKLEKYVKTSRT